MGLLAVANSRKGQGIFVSFLILLFGVLLGVSLGLNQHYFYKPKMTTIWQSEVEGEIVAEVDNQYISLEKVKQELDSVPPKMKAQKLMHMILQDLVKVESISLASDQEYQKKLVQFETEHRVSEYLKSQLPSKEPSRDDLLDYFKKNRSKYQVDEAFKVSHLALNQELIASNRPLNLGEFRQLAKNQSITMDRVQFGKIKKWISQDQFVPVGKLVGLMNLLRNHQQGFCGPIKSNKGWHYFWIEEHRKSLKPQFEELTVKLRNDYLQEERKKAQAKYFESLVSKYGVKIHYDRL